MKVNKSSQQRNDNSYEIKKLKYVVSTPITDGPHETPELLDEGIPFLSAESVKNGIIDFEFKRGYISLSDHKLFCQKVKPQKDDIFIVKSGATTGNCGIVTTDEEFSIWSPLALIRCDNITVLQKYMYYYTLSYYFTHQVEQSWSYGTQQNIGMGVLGNLYVMLPKQEEQKAIVVFLDTQCAKIDSIIADIEQQIETLQKYKKSLITETVTKGLDRSVPMKDSGIVWIGKIPAHWDLKRLKFMLENSAESMKVGPFGSALSGSDFTDEGKWVYNQRVVLDQNFSENTTFVSEEKFREMRSFAVYPGDILITTRGTIGKVAIVPEGASEGILHPCIIKFRIDKGMMMPELLQLIFNESDFVKDQFTLMSNATTIEVIYSYSLKDIILPVIPVDEQREIYDFLSEKCTIIDSVIAEKRNALSAITQHKKSLIYEYVTGKKRVTEVN